MLAEVVQTWFDLGGHLAKVKVQAQLEEVQQRQEELNLVIKKMSPVE